MKPIKWMLYALLGSCIAAPALFGIHVQDSLDTCEQERHESLQAAEGQRTEWMDRAVESEQLKSALDASETFSEKVVTELNDCNEDWVDHKLQYPDETWSRGQGPKAGKGERERRCEHDLAECQIAEEEHRRVRDEYAAALGDCVKGDKVHADLSACLGSWEACKAVFDRCTSKAWRGGADAQDSLSACLGYMEKCKP